LSIPNHFPVILSSYNSRPVVFPPGRAKLVTTPAPTGSDTYTKTIGIVRVFVCNALTTGVRPADLGKLAKAVDRRHYMPCLRVLIKS
jgi:hypothetical protein